MNTDTLYDTPHDAVPPFRFNDAVTDVFDDMISRSVPRYRETVADIVRLATEAFQDRSHIYDLGCSLGAVSMPLAETLDNRPGHLYAVDASEDMIRAFTRRLDNHQPQFTVTPVHARAQDIDLHNASVILLNYTLQFIPADEREELLSRIYQALQPKGILLITEKITDPDPHINEMLIRHHLQFKRANGYSDLAISQKRQALEDVLIPESIAIHTERLRTAGFAHVTVWNQCWNFVSFYCAK